MDKLAKLLQTLTAKERDRLEHALTDLLSGKREGLDIKKLRGFDTVFRLRVGDLRIIFTKEADDVRILEVSRRDDTTYDRR